MEKKSVRPSLRLFRVEGRCMEPFIKPGELLLSCEYKDGEKVNVGDIILVKMKDGLNLHRILAKIRWFGKKYMLEKGDLGKTGSIILDDDIVGIAKYRISDGRILALNEKICKDKLNLQQKWVWTKFMICMILISCRKFIRKELNFSLKRKIITYLLS